MLLSLSNIQEYIVDFLRRAAETGERWELTNTEIDILKATHVI